MRLLPMVMILFLTSCISLPRSKLHIEYDLSNRTWARTPIFNVKVFFPEWLAESDRCDTGMAVDSYILSVRRGYKWAAHNFNFSEYVVIIHNALDRCVSPPARNAGPVWCYGWQAGKTIVVCWRALKDKGGWVTGVAENNILPALPHEYFHTILEARYGDGDPDHKLFPLPEIHDTIEVARRDALTIRLSRATKDAALRYRYLPHSIPGAQVKTRKEGINVHAPSDYPVRGGSFPTHHFGFAGLLSAEHTGLTLPGGIRLEQVQ